MQFLSLTASTYTLRLRLALHTMQQGPCLYHYDLLKPSVLAAQAFQWPNTRLVGLPLLQGYENLLSKACKPYRSAMLIYLRPG